MKKILSFLALTGIIISINVSAYTPTQLESANNLAIRQIIQDHKYDLAKYNLDAYVLRQEVALISRRVSGVAVNTTCKNIFNDVNATKPNDWLCKNVEALVDYKLISHNPSFNPEKNISKAEALIMFIKSVGFIDFEIKDPANWQKEVVDFAVKNGVVEDFTDYKTEAKRGWIFQIADFSIQVKEKAIKQGTWKQKPLMSSEVVL